MKKEGNLYWFLLTAGIILYIYSLWGRIPDVDGAWIGENAYWLAKLGYAKSELMRGITSQDTLTIIHHKLFNLLGALLIKLFGFSIYTLKSISLFFYITLIFLSYQYSVKSTSLLSKKEWALFFVLMSYFPWAFKFSFVYRPEIMITTLGFAAYILLEKTINDKDKRFAPAWFAGILIGLAIATHLNGLVFAASGLFLLIWNNQYKKLLPYSVGVLMAFSIYFYDYFQPGYFSFWYYQFFNSPTVMSAHEFPFLLEPLINILSEHLRYFHDPEIIVFTIFMLFNLTISFRFLYRKHKILTQFTMLMFVFTAMLTIHDTRKYILMNLPFILLSTVLAMKALREGEFSHFYFNVKQKTVYGISFSLMIIYLAVSLGYNIRYSVKKFSPNQNREISIRYAGTNTKEMNIVAPMAFIFNEIEQYNQIQGEVCYTEFLKADSTLTGVKFLEKAESFNNVLLIVTPYFQKLLAIDGYLKGENYGDFTVIDKNDKFVVLKKTSLVFNQ